jgi:hypothetical protein
VKITRQRVYENWKDVAFTALPLGAWINIYRQPDGTYQTYPCPGVLIQEATTRTAMWDEEYDDGRVIGRCRDEDLEERETRTIFADAGGFEDPDLEPCGTAANYVGTVTPDHWEEWRTELLDEQ